MAEQVDRPIILGVVGDSAAGKTTLTRGIAQILGSDRCTVICTDDYHRYDRRERHKLRITALDPEANYIDILQRDLICLRQGLPILKPVYDHRQGELLRPVYVRPKDYVIVEGLLGFTRRDLRDCYDVKLYLDPHEDLRVQWKLLRDTKLRGYTREEVLRTLERRKEDCENYIRPQRLYSDMVLRFEPSISEAGGLEKPSVRHMLRPTLPHPDFSPLFDGVGETGLSFDLARDGDGKPVDLLKIDGNISDERAERLENLLWRLIPEASLIRDEVGQIDAVNGVGISHTLALSQLLVAYHMVKAQIGEHAI